MIPFNLDEYLKNPNKKVVTREGRSVTILCTNFLSSEPIIAEIEELNCSMSFDTNGRHSNNSTARNPSIDLFFAPEKKEGWINVYRGALDITYAGSVYDSKEEAEEHIDDTQCYIATSKIEWEE